MGPFDVNVRTHVETKSKNVTEFSLRVVLTRSINLSDQTSLILWGRLLH